MKRHTNRSLFTVDTAKIQAAVACLLIALWVGDTSYAEAADDKNNAKSDDDLGIASQVGPPHGPRKSISVGEVTSIQSFSAFYGSWDVDGGVAAMLVTALRETDHFVVLERASLGLIISEQELAAAGLTIGGNATLGGEMYNSQLLVVASITEYGTADDGGAIDIGMIGGPMLNKSVSGGSAKAEGRVAMDVRLIDPSTTQVLYQFTVFEEIKDSSHSVDIGYEFLNFGGNTFNKTPLGEATRRMVGKAAVEITEHAKNIPWTGLVVEMENGMVVINGGRRAGVKVGDAFMVQQQTDAYIDPQTGEQVGAQLRNIGVVQISSVEERMAWGALDQKGMEARRGDTVIRISQ